MPLNPYILRRKHFPKLMAFATVMAGVIGTVIYFVVGEAWVAALVAGILVVSDYIGLKLVIDKMEKQNSLPPDDYDKLG